MWKQVKRLPAANLACISAPEKFHGHFGTPNHGIVGMGTRKSRVLNGLRQNKSSMLKWPPVEWIAYPAHLCRMVSIDTFKPCSYAGSMEVQFTPEIQARLERLANESGRSKDELVQDAMPGYLDELERTRQMLDSRYDDIKSGRVNPIDGEEAFARLREKSDARRNGRA